MSTPQTTDSAAREAALEGISPSTFQRRWLILVSLCVSLVAVMIANSSMNLALPSLSRELGLAQLEMTWVIEAYALVFAALLFLASAVADRYGRKRVMQAGLVLFIGASTYAGVVASTGGELIVARTLMGVGGAFVMPTTLSIINVVFPKSERSRAIAVWAGISGAGMVLGSVLSGIILEFSSWEWTFLFGGIIALGALVANQVVVPESQDETGSAVDWLGGALVTAGLFGVVYAIMEAPSQGLTDGPILIALAGGAVALVAFVWWELRTKNPMFDLRIFRAPEVGLSALAITLVFFAMMGAMYGISQIFQLVMGLGILVSALAMLPVMLPMMLVSPFVPRLVERVGTKWTVTPGLLMVASGFALMSMWPAEPAYWQILGGMVVMTTGVALVMTPATNLMMAAVPKNRSGMGSALNDTTRELGAALGIAVLGSMISSGYVSGVTDAITGLPQQAAEIAGGSLAGALVIAEQMGAAGAELAYTAKESFMSGSTSAALVSVVVALGAAAIFAVGIPGHQEPSQVPVEDGTRVK